MLSTFCIAHWKEVYQLDIFISPTWGQLTYETIFIFICGP